MVLAQNSCIEGRCPVHGCLVLVDSACEVCLADSRGGKYGPISIGWHRALDQQGIHLHVFYQGQDVTQRCTFADDTGAGVAHLLKVNADGKKYIDVDGEIAAECVTGIEIRVGEPF